MLSHPSERPALALGRCLLAAVGIALLFAALQVFYGFFPSASAPACLLIGLAISILLLGADRLWFSMIAPMFHRPFSLPAYVSRIPFWYVAGGISFECAVLASRSIGWLTRYDLPIKVDFDLGARLGVLSAGLLQAVLYRWVQQIIRGSASPGSHNEP